MTQDLLELGQMPELGEIPSHMYAQVIRPERFGSPTDAFAVEVVDTPKTLRPDEVLEAQQLMYENRHPNGNMACLVNAPSPGEGRYSGPKREASPAGGSRS